MGKLLKIAVYVAILFLGYLWIASVAKSCNKAKTADTEVISEPTKGTAYEESDEFEDEFFEDEDVEIDLNNPDEMGGGSSTTLIDETPIDYTEVDEIIDEAEETKTTPTRKETPAPVTRTATKTNSNSGKFLLLAGSYLIKDNAQVMVKKLKKLGYHNAEVVVFDMSQYHSVCAGRYSNLSSAQQESSSLKRKGIDNYVHTKQ